MVKSSSLYRAVPVRRSDLRARIFSRPPRAATYRATRSSTFAEDSGDAGGSSAGGEGEADAPGRAADSGARGAGEQAGAAAKDRTRQSAPNARTGRGNVAGM